MTDKPDHEEAVELCGHIDKNKVRVDKLVWEGPGIINLARCYLERCEELAALKECVFGNHKWESAMTKDGDPIQRCTVCGDST